MSSGMLLSIGAGAGYALWSVFQGFATDPKLGNLPSSASRTIISTLPFVLCLAEVLSNLSAKQSTSGGSDGKALNVLGAALALLAGLSTFFGTKLYGLALEAGVDSSVVAAVSGAYPAMAFVLLAALGMEKVNAMKLLGTALAVASTVAFAMSGEVVPVLADKEKSL